MRKSELASSDRSAGKRRRLAMALLVGCFIGLTFVLSAGSTVESQEPGHGSATPAPPSMSSGSWILLPTFPPSATQADVGAEIYRLVCSACHAADGTGLTGAWLASWAPEDRNCWQSKCHALNHPPDGFLLPTYVPAVVGPPVTSRFRTALDLYEYVRQYMPWQAPGTLQDDEYWKVTAFLVRLNGVDPVKVPLDQERAAQLLLQPQATNQPAATSADTAPETSATPKSTPIPATAEPMPHAGTTPAARNTFGGRGLVPVALLAVAGICVAMAIVLLGKRRPGKD